MIDQRLQSVLAELRSRIKKPHKPRFNWVSHIAHHWHRGALYLSVAYQTPHGRPPSFTVNVARIQHAGSGSFDFALPMRRGWNTVAKGSTVLTNA